MNTFSLSPLLRSSIGFDRFNDLFESLASGESSLLVTHPITSKNMGKIAMALRWLWPGSR